MALLTIGDFSRMSYLSVKALRHYHEMGLLEPAAVDPDSGYRLYLPSQVGVAQVIRRLRDLGMSLEGVHDVIAAPDVEARNAAMVAHLRRMERQLEQTRTSVASLRALLSGPVQGPIEIEYRADPPVRALAVLEQVSMTDAEAWWSVAFDRLHGELAAYGWQRSGPDGALYSSEFFQADAGEVIAFIPIEPPGESSPSPERRGRPAVLELPAVEMAVTVHTGPLADLDRAYAALGTYVAERAIGVDGPIRENYLHTAADTPDEAAHLTEVCWPIFQTTPRARP